VNPGRMVLLLAAGALGWGSTVAGQSVPPVSFARDIQPFFDRQCVHCHTGDDHLGELVLERGASHGQTVEHASVEVPSLPRIAPGEPERSYLFLKMTGTHGKVGGQGWPMPPATPLPNLISSADRENVRRWIMEGAKDDSAPADLPPGHAVGAGKAPGGHAGTRDGVGQVSLARDIQPLLASHLCLNCHFSRVASGGLNLEPPVLHGNLVKAQATEAPMALVVPGDLESSYLVHKLRGTHLGVGGSGERMPMGSLLDSQSLDLVQAWIKQGARDN